MQTFRETDDVSLDIKDIAQHIIENFHVTCNIIIMMENKSIRQAKVLGF